MKKIVTILCILFVVSSSAFAQSFKVGLGGGLAIVNSPDALTNDISKGGLGFSSEYQVGLKGKFGVPVLPFKLIGEINYSLLNGEEEFSMVYYSETVDVKAETETSILSFGLATITLNTVNELKVKSTWKYNGVTYPTEEETYGDKVSRTGIGVGAGVSISILPIIDIDITAKYNIVNLLGKEDGEETISTTSLMATVFVGF